MKAEKGSVLLASIDSTTPTVSIVSIERNDSEIGRSNSEIGPSESEIVIWTRFEWSEPARQLNSYDLYMASLEVRNDVGHWRVVIPTPTAVLDQAANVYSTKTCGYVSWHRAGTQRYDVGIRIPHFEGANAYITLEIDSRTGSIEFEQ